MPSRRQARAARLPCGKRAGSGACRTTAPPCPRPGPTRPVLSERPGGLKALRMSGLAMSQPASGPRLIPLGAIVLLHGAALFALLHGMQRPVAPPTVPREIIATLITPQPAPEPVRQPAPPTPQPVPKPVPKAIEKPAPKAVEKPAPLVRKASPPKPTPVPAPEPTEKSISTPAPPPAAAAAPAAPEPQAAAAQEAPAAPPAPAPAAPARLSACRQAHGRRRQGDVAGAGQ